MIDIQHADISRGQSIQDAYDEFFQERVLLMRDSFYLWILELACPAPGDLLVDVATGNGRLVELAAAQGINALGVDLSYEGIAKAAATAPPAATWLVTDGQCIALPDASVDRAISLGSLEHYDDPVQGAAEIARILKPNGRAVVLLPNAYGIFGNIRYVWEHGEVFDDGQPHQRYATRGTWEMMLRRAGLTPERLVAWTEINRPRTQADFDYLLRRPQKWLRAALAAPFPANLANQLVFLCRRGTAAEKLAAAAHYTTLPNHFSRNSQ
jgi:SAM-dependent methyltransferase